MLELFGIEVINEEIEWGEAPTSEQVSRLLTTYQTISAVWIVQCETSTGTATNIKAIADIIHAQSNALVCVDGVSSVGAMECVMDEWKIDALICGSQKALMTPPGLGFVALSERAWNIVENRKSASYYFDLLRIRRAAEKHLGVFTPAVSLLMGVDAALQSIINEGLEQVIARHSRVASIIRDGVIECGLRLVPRFPANSLTVVTLENAPKIINQLQEKYGIIVAGGQDCFAGKVIRIGHLGYVFEEDARYFTECLKNIVGL
jgi:aspartate aminotransferase-like enzyme